MSSGEFEAQLQQSVQAHRDAIAEMVAQAKRRIESGVPVSAPQPSLATDSFAADPFAPEPFASEPFEDDAFVAARSGSGPAVRFDDFE